MGVIKKLDASTILQLAAGEIIDRPVSIVKELVDNAIDSGASAINVSITQGGIHDIGIEDNGCGMNRDDLEQCVLPHATSKLTTYDDIERVQTMGFRGEALASIAAVAHTTIHSCHKDSDIGCQLTVCPVDRSNQMIERARSVGTSVRVSHLFKHIPVRFRFLKSAATEFSYIHKCIQQFAIHYPFIAFTLIHNEGMVLETNGKGDTLITFSGLVGTNIDDIMVIDRLTGDVQITGVMTPPNQTFKHRQKCWFAVNQRMVQSPVFFTAIQAALSDIIPKQRYPALAINISIPTEMVDINTHPKKESVTFIDNNEVFTAIRRAIRSATITASRIVQTAQEQLEQVTTGSVQKDTLNPWSVHQWSSIQSSQLPMLQAGHKRSVAKAIPEKPTVQSDLTASFQTKPLIDSDSPKLPMTWFSFKNKYIIVPTDHALMVFDQHAVHERILYDQFSSTVSDTHTQPLLIPEHIHVQENHAALIDEQLPILRAMGLCMERFHENAFIIREVPQLFNRIQLKEWVLDWLNLDTIHAIAELPEATLKEQLKMKACKAAVKAGQPLHNEEVRALLEHCLMSDQQYTCPHGRPLFTELTVGQLDRLFLRR